MTDPLICCICPWHERLDFVQQATRCYVAQSYRQTFWYPLDTSRELKGKSVGEIRNVMVERATGFDLIAHFDYDDISAPDRLQYQLDFMRSTGVPVVGFNDMLFYDAVQDRVLWYESKISNYALGTSLFYKREAWERIKFPDQTPEDTTWQHQIGHDNIRGCSSIVDGKPMMIQVLHGKNAAASAAGSIFQKANAEQEKAVRDILATA